MFQAKLSNPLPRLKSRGGGILLPCHEGSPAGKTKHPVLGIGVLIFCLAVLIFSRPAQAGNETLTLETYYPAPYGIYNEFTTTGQTLLATESGNVGIGTTGPLSKLDIRGANDKGAIASFENILNLASNNPNPLTLRAGIQTGLPAIRYGAIEVDDAGTKRNLVLQPTSGFVGIGTTSPGAKLEVNGQVIITDGSQADGYVLTSNADGLASWQQAGAGIYLLDSPILVARYSACSQFVARSWYTLSVSSYVPSTATSVLLRGVCGENVMWVKASGSTLPADGNLIDVCRAGNNSSDGRDYIVKLDAQKYFKWANYGTDCDSMLAEIYLRGWM